jgi:nucleobase transporter 1/2
MQAQSALGIIPIQTGSSEIDQLLLVLGSTSMFVGGAIAFVLDNTIAGTDDERGATKWLGTPSPASASSVNLEMKGHLDAYDLPIGMKLIRK